MVTLNKLSEAGFEPDLHQMCSQMVVGEKRSKYVLTLEPKMEGWKYRVDGYIIVAGDKCDALFLSKDGDDYAEVFVELKGSDVDHAITQLEETIKHEMFRDSNALIRWARISTHSYPKSTILDQKVNQKTAAFQENYRCELRITRSDSLTHELFEDARKNNAKGVLRININESLHTGDPSKINAALTLLIQRLKVAQHPETEVKTDWLLLILALLCGIPANYSANALKYVKLSVCGNKACLLDDNVAGYLNAVLEKFSTLYDGNEFTLPEEIEDKQNDVKQSLLAIYGLMKESEAFNGDDEFWKSMI